MLRNDEFFWNPDGAENAAWKSWSSSGGDFAALWEQTRTRWRYITRLLGEAGVPTPSGKILEFGAGVGHLDDLLDQTCTGIVMLDHTDAYINARSRPLSARCRHVLWSEEAWHALRREPVDFDWLIILGVFWHVDDATAVALIRTLGQLLRPGGHVLIEGMERTTPELVREMADEARLFQSYPRYSINADLVRDALAPEYRELARHDQLVYRKTPPREGALKRIRARVPRH
jgi:2-polyprenyl-3-methyl-5-hydroxy-6-metoxy-1,4-benzoquinol methylase